MMIRSRWEEERPWGYRFPGAPHVMSLRGRIAYPGTGRIVRRFSMPGRLRQETVRHSSFSHATGWGPLQALAGSSRPFAPQNDRFDPTRSARLSRLEASALRRRFLRLPRRAAMAYVSAIRARILSANESMARSLVLFMPARRSQEGVLFHYGIRMRQPAETPSPHHHVVY